MHYHPFAHASIIILTPPNRLSPFSLQLLLLLNSMPMCYLMISTTTTIPPPPLPTTPSCYRALLNNVCPFIHPTLALKNSHQFPLYLRHYFLPRLANVHFLHHHQFLTLGTNTPTRILSLIKDFLFCPKMRTSWSVTTLPPC